MLIEKVLNNNVAAARDKTGREVIVMGRGIAFQRRSGDIIPEKLVEKVFVLENSEIAEKLGKLASQIPLEHILIAEEIITLCETLYHKKLQDGIHISLADHISAAIERQQKGISLNNPLRWDIQRIYPEEYLLGQKALKIIREKVAVSLDDDEAAFIAMHFVNAEMNQDLKQFIPITKIMNDLLGFVEKESGVVFDTTSINYYRFITHLKFFAQRIIESKIRQEDVHDLYLLVKDKYSRVFSITEKTMEYLHTKYNYSADESEKTYFTIHLQRIMNLND